MAAKEVEQIAVIGAGTMGHGIAQVAALKGFRAIMTDVSEEILARALERIKWSLGKLAEKGLIGPGEIDEVLGRIGVTTSLEEAVAGSDAVIEAVFEDISVKKEVLTRADRSAPKAALIATNTSSIPINELASALSRPDRFLGMHFFNPPQLNELVEIILGRETSHQVRETAFSLAKRLGKSPVIVRKDVPGFIVNRVMLRMIETASHLVETGRYSVEAIDSAMIYRLGFPMGVFELADYVGLDVLLMIMKVVSARDPTLKVARIVEEKVSRGEIGAKAQRGFYSYSGRIYERPMISPSLGAGVDLALIVAPALNEAARLIDEGVASREDVEKAIKLGLNLPRPIFQYLEDIDSTRIREALRIYEKELGPGYAPSTTLLETQKTPPNREQSGEISIVREPPIGWVMLKNPYKLNALTLKMLEEIETSVREMDKDPAIRVIVLKGVGDRAFSAGADITVFKDLLAGEEDKAAKAREISEKFYSAAHTIESCQKPVIAAIDGYALGGGLELALACDLRIASDRSELGLPEINLGMIPGGGGTQRLVRLVGPAKALEMILTGERVRAEEAYRIGLVNHTVPKESFDDEVKAFALKLAEKPPLALRAAKLTLRIAQETHIREGLTMEKHLFGELFNTQDLTEGVSAFLAKRRPEFKGR